MQFLKKIWKNIKKVRLSTLVLLIAILAFTSYAWFAYVSRVSTGLSAHVSAWQVTFSLNNEEIQELEVDVGRIYPGMEDFDKAISIYNDGEIDGQITFEITRMEILGEVYEISDDVTAQDLTNMVENDFPFSVILTVEGTDDNVIQVNTTKLVRISLVWPYESGDDDLDTLWGEKAYTYYQAHPDAVSVHLNINLKVHQIGS